MGACNCGITLKGRTREAQTKEFWKIVKEARNEYGQGYTGTAAEFCELIFTGRVFNSYEEADDFLDSKENNVAYVYELKVVEDTATIKKWLTEYNELAKKLWTLSSNEVLLKKQINKKREVILAKIKAARIRKAEKTKKTITVASGWVSE